MYRSEGREKRLSPGTCPDVGLKDARDRREEARKLLVNGIDPGNDRKALKAARADQVANTFEVLTRELYEKHVASGVPSYSKLLLRLFKRDIFPWIISRSVGDIMAPRLLTVLRRIENRQALETAHRAHGDCGQVFRCAIATGHAERDPSADLHDFRKVGVENTRSPGSLVRSPGTQLRWLQRWWRIGFVMK